MSTEPKKPIENLLDAYAQKRRKNAGDVAQPHRVTRKILQDQVAQTYRSSEATSARSPFALLMALWPRAAFGAAILACLLVMVGIFTKDRPDEVQQIAAKKSPPAEMVPEVASGEHARPDAQAESETRRTADTLSRNKNEIFSESSKESITIVTVRDASAELDSIDTTKKLTEPTLEKAPAPSAPVPAGQPLRSQAEKEVLIAEGRAEPSPDLAETKFAKVKNSAAKDAIAPAARGDFAMEAQEKFIIQGSRSEKVTAMQAFRVERERNTVRVVDADGSVYSGAVIGGALAGSKSELAMAAAKGTLSADNSLGAGGDFLFSVSGTNNALKQRVTFSGRYIANAPSPESLADKSDVDTRTLGVGAANPSSQVVGTLILDQTNRVEIQAITGGQ